MYVYIYIYIYIYNTTKQEAPAARSWERGDESAPSRTSEPLLIFTSTCPLKVRISQGLVPFFQIYI